MAIDIGIDLGTASVIVYLRNKGIVLNEPTIASVDKRTGRIMKIGMSAYKALGRTPSNIEVIAPLKDGVISDLYVTEHIIRYFIKKVCGNRISKPRVVICVPSGVTEVESRAVIEATTGSGVKSVHLIEEAVAAALGAGLNISEPHGKMVIDIGGGTASAAIMSLNGVVSRSCIKVGGKRFDESLIKFIKTNHNVLIGPKTAEEIKKVISNVYNPDSESVVVARGRDLMSGLPKTIEISEMDSYKAYYEHIYSIASMAQSVLEQTPPELVGDIYDQGIVMTGGGSLLRGLPEFIEKKLRINTVLAEDPINCVAIGTGLSFDDPSVLMDMEERMYAY